MISEIGVYFFPNGGHDHDGVNSSLIDTSAYSIFDFEWTTEGSTPFRDFLRQIRYTQSFLPAIRQEITNVLFKDAGIFIQPGSVGAGILIANSITANEIAANTITANEIAAGTITGNLFSANVVLVNQLIRSNNYSPGVSGWAINGNGDAEFANTSIRGTLTAVELLIDGNNFWEDDGFMLGGNTGIYTEGGNVKIGTNVIIEGAVTAVALAIDENNFWSANGFVLGGNTGIYTSNGVVRIGTSVIIEGTVAADEVVIDEDNYWNANSFSLNGENGVSTVPIANIGQVVRLGTDIYINPNDGSIFSGSGAFQVQSNGNLFSNSGDIGGWTIANDYLQSQEANPGQLTIGKFDANTSGIAVEDGSRIAMFELVGDGLASDARLYVGHTNGSNYFKSTYDVEGAMYTETTGRIVSTSAFFGPLFSTGDNVFPFPQDGTYITEEGIYTAGNIYADGTLESGGGIESGDMITAGGTGVYYNASNLSGGRFGIAFGWDQSGYLSCIVNDDTNVDPYFAPDGFYSDRRMKENIQSVASEVLQKIYNIKIYEFDYKTDIPQSWLQGKHSIGVIADEFATLFPEMVTIPENPEKYDQVVYVKMIPHLLAAIGDLNTRLKALEQQLGYNS